MGTYREKMEKKPLEEVEPANQVATLHAFLKELCRQLEDTNEADEARVEHHTTTQKENNKEDEKLRETLLRLADNATVQAVLRKVLEPRP